MHKELRTRLATTIAALSIQGAGCGGAAEAMSPSMAAQDGMAKMATVSADSEGMSDAREEVSADSAGAAPMTHRGNDTAFPQSSPGAPPPPTPPKAPQPTQTPTSSAGTVAQVRAPILIYTARLTLAVFEVEKNLKAIEALAKEVGGYLARRDERQIAIRVPVGQFESVLKRIEKLGDVTARNVETEDVTEEYLDIEVRLRNARAVRDRLEQLLAKAVKVEESLIVERELNRVAGEIERMVGRMKYLRERAAFSLVTVVFEPRSTKPTLPKMAVNMPVPWLYELGIPRLLVLKTR